MIPRGLFGIGLAGALAALAGCDRKPLTGMLVPNQPPTVRLTAGPIDTTGSYSYVVRLHWLGYDPDGQVTHFEYALLEGLASPDTVTVWQPIARQDSVFLFRSATVDTILPNRNTLYGFHTFVLRAVDDRGARSEPVWRSFHSHTIAPAVRFISPIPSHLLIPMLPPVVFVRWDGDDPDGEYSQRPLKYKFKLFRTDDPAIDLSEPLSFNRFGPAFADWDSVSGDTTFAFFTDLDIGTSYVVALTGFDEAGAYDPLFTLRTNLLRFRVAVPVSLGPLVTVFNEYVDFSYSSGGYSTDDSRRIRTEIPAGRAVRWSWYGTSLESAPMRRTRWKLDDAVDLDDPTPRTDEVNDLAHWSQWRSVGQVRADAFTMQLPPFPGTACDAPTLERHTLYIEVEDAIGLKSLAMVEFTPVQPCFGDRILVVDDRRGLPDQFRGVAPNLVLYPPAGLWPTEAELDTFLFAVGGVPWKGYAPSYCLPATPNCPTTQLMSPPGIFAGYAFDTLDTRRGLPDGTVAASVLARYRHVLWFTDAPSAAVPYFNQPNDPLQPLTSLVYMNWPGRPNPLGIYSGMGGRLLLFGGGVVMGSVYGWIAPTLGYIWSATGQNPALVPGRFAYDILGLRSEVRSYQGSSVRAHPLRPAALAGLVDMGLKRSGDPPPPFRTVSNMPSSAVIEHVTQPLQLLEDADPDPDRWNEVSVLDTLFGAYGIAVQLPGAPCGLHYHGSEHGQVVLLGFDLWSWKRAQVIQNVDAILQGLWGVPRAPVSR